MFCDWHLKPLVKWSGGKHDELPQFESWIPRDGIGRYVEPFAGGAALYFHLAPKVATLSDVHDELVAFYRKMAMPGGAAEVERFMETHPNDEATYYDVRGATATAMDPACRFFYLRKTCYRGMMRYNKQGGFNVPFGRYKQLDWSALRDERYATLLGETEILCESFEKVFERHGDDPANFFFLDPPYDSTFTDYGFCEFGKDEHERLARCFKRARAKCLMVIGETDMIRDLYDGYICDSYIKKYRFRLHSDRIKTSDMQRRHLVIKNYD